LLETDKESLIAKCYFKHPDDKRDRLHAEYTFLTYASSQGINSVPSPVASDSNNGVGIYSYIEGRPLNARDITKKSVLEAAGFFQQLNSNRHQKATETLPMASEACFSIEKHCELIELRVNKLRNIKPTSGINRRAVDFTLRLEKCWEEVKKIVRKKATGANISYREELPNEQRCVSPSDFGFHNALITKNGHIIFLDFEYAGWDDPGKMGADFFCQPQLPVPLRYMPEFLKTALMDFNQSEQLVKRVYILLSAYRVKWCCIILNEFVPEFALRRKYARKDVEMTNIKIEQLEKAELILNLLQSEEL